MGITWIASVIYTQAYSYDLFGNRKIDSALTNGTGVNRRVYNPNPLNNRLRELVYDKAGNVLSETLYGSRLEVREYDAENRMTRAASNGGAQQSPPAMLFVIQDRVFHVPLRSKA